MYKKKLLISFTSLPFAYYCFTSLEFHRMRAKEKRTELAKREVNLQKAPLDLGRNNLLNEVTSDLNIKNFNNKWAYIPFQLTGKFDFSKELKISSNKNGMKGYEIICPFEYFKDNLNEKGTIYVSRGFVDDNFSQKFNRLSAHNSNGYTTIQGVVTQVHRNKNDDTNDYVANELHEIQLQDFAKIHGIKNATTKIIFKEINFSNTNSNTFPLTDSVQSLSKFNVSESAHLCWKNAYLGSAFLVIFSNMYFWVCL